jgi:hypothetical protein
MPSLVTDNFRVFAAQQFIESLAEPFTGQSQDADSSTSAQNYRSKIYLFIGRSYNWNDLTGTVKEKYGSLSSVSDQTPPNPVDNLDELNEIYDDMIAIKRIQPTDVSHVIRKRNWQSGIVYDMYRHDYGPSNLAKASLQSKLYDSNFYVLTDDFRVYKCIYNGQTPASGAYPNGKPSTVKPTATTPTIQTTGDGYRWKYMYTITIADYIKFVSTDFIPVKIESAVVNAAIPGSVDQVLVQNAGSGLTINGSTTSGTVYASIDGNGSGGVVAITISSGAITSASVSAVGTGYTFGYVDLSKCYSQSNLSGSVVGLGVNSTTASIIPIISPPGGHGKNALNELGGYRVMINKSIEFLDGNGDIPVNMEFRRFGLIEDPQISSLDFVETTGTVCKAVKFLSTTPETTTFLNGEIITQTRTVGGITYEAKGRVIHWDSVNKVLRYYQNEYISETQTTTSKNKLINFEGNSTISSATGSATPDSAFNGTIAGLPAIEFTSGYFTSEITPYSGNILYVENRKPVFRSNDQIEDVKLVIEF